MTELTELQRKLAEQLLLTIKNREMNVTYEELAERVSPPIHHRNVGKNIGQVSLLCHELGLPLISAKVVNKNTHTAGEGFYTLYESLGIPTKEMNEKELYKAELKAIRECQEWYILEDHLGLDIGFDRPKPQEEPEDIALIEDLKADPLRSAPSRFEYLGVSKEKAAPVSEGERKSYPRDRSTAINALVHAGYKCEIDGSHTTFLRKNSDRPYTEPHHLVPIAFSDDFDVSLDVEENIVSLCSNCHDHIHYGQGADELLTKLYYERRELLKRVGIDITLEQLLAYYR